MASASGLVAAIIAATASATDITGARHTQFAQPALLFQSFLVAPLALFGDNYAYVLIDLASNQLALVDPAEPAFVQPFLRALLTSQPQLKFTTILATHKHWDHSGGNGAFKKEYPDVEVVGEEGAEAVTKVPKHGAEMKLGQNTLIQVMEAPCHTSGHLLYFVKSSDTSSSNSAAASSVIDAPVLFSGDTLFIAGCGKFFEGNADQMHRNLNSVIASLPPSTLVLCGHEYTVSNLEFARWVEEGNAAIQDKLKWAEGKRKDKHETIGSESTIGGELEHNPFMRVQEETVRAKIKKWLPSELPKDKRALEVAVLHALREAKNANAHKLGK